MRTPPFGTALAMKFFAFTAILAQLCIFTGIGWANSAHLDQKSAHVATEKPNWPQLAAIQFFDVQDWQMVGFSASRSSVPPEIGEYARTALQNQPHLRYGSTDAGILKFDCLDAGCYRVRAQVTQGVDGPVVWEDTQAYRRCPLMRFTFQPDSQKFARKMVNRLAQDYVNALRPTMAKIEIENE